MSRARPIIFPDGEKIWFDTNRNGEKATGYQLELLATLETDCDLDDLLDQSLSQGQILDRLRKALGMNSIPLEVIERRQKWREERQVQPKCRMCRKEGDSTRHHFVNKWLLRELSSYAKDWADRSKNCIPLCIDCHRDLHYRGPGEKSIADLLTDDEKRFAHQAIRALLHEKPKLYELIILGDPEVSYETRLIRDWGEGKFLVSDVRAEIRLAA